MRALAGARASFDVYGCERTPAGYLWAVFGGCPPDLWACALIGWLGRLAWLELWFVAGLLWWVVGGGVFFCRASVALW